MQLRLPGLEPDRQVKPESGRPEPAFWIRRLRILRELEPGEQHIIRDIELRRGLNVIWAPPHHPSPGNTLFRDGVAGHTAGKTTFCRLLRHVLGEGAFANESTRGRIRDQIPSGWVLAEVMLERELWTVARPFAIGAHPFCVAGGTINDVHQAERLDYREFTSALNDILTRSLTASRFPSSEKAITADVILPWLTRDQECRFSEFVEWRHSTSQAGSPSLTVEDRQFMLRAVLGLISDEERGEQERNARLISEKSAAEGTEPLLRHEARTHHERVERLLGKKFAEPSSPLFGSEAGAELRLLRDRWERARSQLIASDERPRLRDELDSAIRVEEQLRRALEDAEQRLAVEKGALDNLEGKGLEGLFASLKPSRDYCNVPMTVALEQGCPLAVPRPVPLAEQRAKQSADEELEALRRVVKSLERAVDEAARRLQSAEKITKDARQNLWSASTRYDEQWRVIANEEAQIRSIEELIDETERAWTHAEEQTALVKNLAREIDGSYITQKAIREKHSEALERFSERFDYIIRAILGDEVHGIVEAAGRSISLVVKHHGERDSAALSTLKLLAFDLAALTSGIEGKGFFPRFLLHDGPREADISRDIYERIFLYVRSLEDCFPTHPSFQYIITTTSRPPDELRMEPWLRLTLAGSPAEERLLRCDL